MKINSKGVISLRQRRYFLTLACFLMSVLTISGIFKLVANAQYGDFVNNIKTTMRILNQENGAEKTRFLSGETVNLASRVEVTSDGQNSINYNNAYLLVKMPKQYVQGSPKYTPTSAVSSQEKQDTNTHFIQKFNYNVLQSGTINSINFDVALKSIDTPEGYVFGVVHELYDAQGKLLSSQYKEFITTKNTPTLNAGKSKTNGDKNTQYIATYTDATNTTIDRSSFERMGVVSYSLKANIAYPGGENGRRKPRNIMFTDNVPEHMEVSEESINQGWSFDPVSRRATYNLTDPQELSHTTASVNLKLKFKNDTPENIFGKKVVNTANIEYFFEDGLKLEKQASHSLTVRALLKTNEDAFGIGKSVAWYNSENINDTSDDTPAVYWDVEVIVKNNGQTDFVPISSIFDDLPEEFYAYQTDISFSNIDYDKLAFDKIDLIGHTASGEKHELGQFDRTVKKIYFNTKNPKLDLKSIVKLEMKFKDGYQLPVQVDGVNGYNIKFRVYTKFRDVNSVKQSIPNNGTNKYINQAYTNILNNNLRVEASINFTRKASKVVNELSITNKQYTTNDRVWLNTLYNGIVDGSVFPMPLSSLDRNAKSMILFSQDMGISNEMLKAIQDGTVTYIRDYKNTGKSAIINNGTSRANSFIESVNPGDIFVISDNTRSGEHTFELVTFWPETNGDYYGTAGIDDLDFNDDGINSNNVARTSARINVIKPEQVGVSKKVRSMSLPFSKSVQGLQPGEEIEYQLSIINAFDDALRSARILEVLPRINDKNIVEGNDGVQMNRNSTTSVHLTKPIEAKNGFTILYSTDEPGSTKDESWAKNFVPENQIADWSQVRMIKILQNPDYEIAPQTIVDFVLSAKVADDAKDNSIANNTVAVAVRGSNLVESEVVPAKVEYPGKIEGVAFEDMNKNSLFDEDNDTALSDYAVKLYSGDKLIATTTTDDKGHYEFTVKNLGTYTVKFEKPATADNRLAIVPNRNGSQTANNGSNYDSMDGESFVSISRKITATDKNHKLNIGFEIPRGNVIAKYQLQDGTEISPDVVVKNNAPVGENYNATKNNEITKNNLVYVFSTLKNDSAPESGQVEANDKVVTYIYTPKSGSSVKVQFYNEQGNQINPEATIYADGTQVGKEYSSAPPLEITVQGVTYVYKELKNDSAPQVGRVKDTPQVVKYVYTPKSGGQVVANFVDEQGKNLKTTKIVKDTNTPVGTPYSDTPEEEITTDTGLVYVYDRVKSGNQNGTVGVDNQEIVYQYKKKEGGEVKAKFVDKNGKEIQPDSTISPKGTQVGTPWQSQKSITLEIDGKKYKLVQTNGAESGVVTEQDTEVIYVYEEEAVPPTPTPVTPSTPAQNPTVPVSTPNTGFAGFSEQAKYVILSIISLVAVTFAIRKGKKLIRY